MLHTGLFQADVAASTQAEGADTLGDGSFDAGSAVVAPLPSRVVLIGPILPLDLV